MAALVLNSEEYPRLHFYNEVWIEFVRRGLQPEKVGFFSTFRIASSLPVLAALTINRERRLLAENGRSIMPKIDP